MNMDAAIVAMAHRYSGTKEWPGAKSNPAVEAFFSQAGHPGLTDDVPWCAAFVGAVLAECGIKGSGSLMARSYVNWGVKVSPQEAGAGCVAVIPRGKPPQGHVFIVTDIREGMVHGIGGNQSDQVSAISVPVATVIAFRRADTAAAAGTGRSTIRQGSSGIMVIDLQDQLSSLGYFAGKIDGDFGALTQASVLSFQSDHGLEVDGIVGRDTWAALADGTPRPLRAVTAADLRKRGSTTLANTDLSTVMTVGGGAVSVLTIASEKAQEASQALSQSRGALDAVQDLVVAYWPLLLAGVLFGVAIYAIRRIAAARVRDAQTGANLGR